MQKIPKIQNPQIYHELIGISLSCIGSLQCVTKLCSYHCRFAGSVEEIRKQLKLIISSSFMLAFIEAIVCQALLLQSMMHVIEELLKYAFESALFINISLDLIWIFVNSC